MFTSLLFADWQSRSDLIDRVLDGKKTYTAIKLFLNVFALPCTAKMYRRHEWNCSIRQSIRLRLKRRSQFSRERQSIPQILARLSAAWSKGRRCCEARWDFKWKWSFTRFTVYISNSCNCMWQLFNRTLRRSLRTFKNYQPEGWSSYILQLAIWNDFEINAKLQQTEDCCSSEIRSTNAQQIL
jgi:hypothetical protein